jgi:hypothetical protein
MTEKSFAQIVQEYKEHRKYILKALSHHQPAPRPVRNTVPPTMPKPAATKNMRTAPSIKA